MKMVVHDEEYSLYKLLPEKDEDPAVNRCVVEEDIDVEPELLERYKAAEKEFFEVQDEIDDLVTRKFMERRQKQRECKV